MTFVDRAALPEPMAELWRVLQQEGFLLAEEDYSEADFGNAFGVLLRGKAAVRFVRDRGQWFVEVGGPGGSEWYSPMVWRSYLQGEVGDASTPAMDQQCRFIVQALDQIVAAVDTDTELLENLHRYRAQRAQVRRDLSS